MSLDDTFSLPLGVVNRTDFVKFAGAGGDFNPIHHDDEFARASGFPSVFAMGMLTASLASRLLTERFALASIRTYEVRFRSMVWPGENLVAKGRIADRFELNGEALVRITFEVLSGDGEVKITGSAEVREDIKGVIRD
jgi:acyl dehydratase